MKTCSECRHFVRFGDEKHGQCYFNPPVMFASGDMKRPVLRLVERACGQFSELPPNTVPEVKVKANIPTHGQVNSGAKRK